MPVYHFTLHAYRSWNTDHPKGYIQRDEPGIKPTSIPLAKARNKLAKFPEVIFSKDDATFLVEQSRDVTKRRNLVLYAATAIDTHLHLVAGWKDVRNADDIQGRLKQGFGFVMAKRRQTKGRPYFSRGGIPEPVKTKRHLLHLLYEYLPKHNGPMWRLELK